MWCKVSFIGRTIGFLAGSLVALSMPALAQDSHSELQKTVEFFQTALRVDNPTEIQNKLSQILPTLSPSTSKEEVDFIKSYTGELNNRDYDAIRTELSDNFKKNFGDNYSFDPTNKVDLQRAQLLISYSKFRVDSPGSKFILSTALPARIRAYVDAVTAAQKTNSVTAPVTTATPTTPAKVEVPVVVKPSPETKALAEKIIEVTKTLTSPKICAPKPTDTKAILEYVQKAGDIEKAKKKAELDELRIISPFLKDQAGTLAWNMKPGQVVICSREEGCHLEADAKHMNRDSHYENIVVHHTAGNMKESAANIQRYHMTPQSENGPPGGPWADIGYHFVIATDPKTGVWKVYKGRELKYQGAHIAGDTDLHKIGIVVAGNFEEEEKPPPEALQLLTNLVAELSNPNSKTCQGAKCEGIKIQIEKVSGHCDHQAKACPGKNLINAIRALDAKYGENSRKLRLLESVIKYDPKSQPTN